MLCQNCNENEANVRYSQNINGVKKEMILCGKCAKKLGIGEMTFSMPINFSNFFGDFMGLDDIDIIPELARPKELKCPTCGTSYDEFLNIGKFGCSNCYDTFSERIDPILRKIHGNNRYIGERKEKTEKPNLKIEKEEVQPKINKKEQLEQDLKQAISEERYEDAARIRDEIKKIN